MVDKIHYRWDFIGLSTDSKPTPAESPKVVDGSTYYESDTSKLFVFYKDTWYEKTATGGGGTSYTAGEGIDITNDEISVDTETIQPKLTAGTNITIDEDNVISAEGGGGATVVQTTGQSTTDVMSQKAVTDMAFHEGDTLKVQVGQGANVSVGGTSSAIAIGTTASATQENTTAIGTSATASNSNSIAVGWNSVASSINTVALGRQATARGQSSVAIGWKATATQQGQFDISTGNNDTAGYNSSNYRLLTGLYDPQNAHDAATKGYVDTKLGSLTLVSLTQSAYDALTTKDANTLYIITGA